MAPGASSTQGVAAVSSVLPAVPASVRQARALAREVCEDTLLPAQQRELVVLLVSEAVTNAVLHARSEARLTITTTLTSVRVEVGDDSPEHPEVLHLGPHAVHGRGVGLLDRLATTWGVRETAVGKVVWFTVEAA